MWSDLSSIITLLMYVAGENLAAISPFLWIESRFSDFGLDERDRDMINVSKDLSKGEDIGRRSCGLNSDRGGFSLTF